MKRREFITLLGCGAAAWPIAALAQQSDQMRRIAVLMNNAEDDPEGQTRAAAFRQGLQALGWTEGKNLRIDWYWTTGDIGRIRGDMMELAERPPDMIVANGRAILSEAMQVIRSIPVVFVPSLIRSGRASFRVWRVLAEMLPALPSSNTRCLESRWNYSTRSRPQ
jgi:putative tryptophan/tyrosine transport system substrate-binding protein